MQLFDKTPNISPTTISTYMVCYQSICVLCVYGYMCIYNSINPCVIKTLKFKNKIFTDNMNFIR